MSLLSLLKLYYTQIWRAENHVIKILQCVWIITNTATDNATYSKHHPPNCAMVQQVQGKASECRKTIIILFWTNRYQENVHEGAYILKYHLWARIFKACARHLNMRRRIWKACVLESARLVNLITILATGQETYCGNKNLNACNPNFGQIEEVWALPNHIIVHKISHKSQLSRSDLHQSQKLQRAWEASQWATECHWHVWRFSLDKYLAQNLHVQRC